MERASILSGDSLPDAEVFSKILGSSAEAADDDHDLNIRRRVDGLEKRLIATALRRSGGRKRDAAVLLGIDPKNLGYYQKKHGIAEPAEESAP